MTRLLVHVEGQTEESFVNEVLALHLYNRGFSSVRARLLGNPRRRDRRGGIVSWRAARRDIVGHLKEDRGSFATTMVDYYGMPHSWPGRKAPGGRDATGKAEAVEDALAKDVGATMGSRFDGRRFIPYVAMHEFEALLFSDCNRFAAAIDQSKIAACLQEIRDEFLTPEEIDDSPKTAPSKRVVALVPGYKKPLFGTLAALEIGLCRLRRECPHFADWLARLEACVA